jgi:hypothetical protein
MAAMTIDELAAQVAAASRIRSAAARVHAPERLRERLAEQLEASRGNPGGPARSSTDMRSFPASVDRAQPPAADARPGRRRQSWWLAARGLGALATLGVGAVHLQQYLELYSAVPTIGTLFVLNFAGATVIGLALLAPVERMAGRLGAAAVALLAVAAIVLAATSFLFLLISEHTQLFGFMEPGYDPAAIAAARGAEAATVALLGTFLTVRYVARVPMPRW